MEFLTQWFDTSGFPARWQCGVGWTDSPWLGWMHILSDVGIWSAYLAIPIVLGYFLARRSDVPFRKVFLLFGAFILACGTTHLLDAILFWWPAYRLAGLVKLFTALVSWATVIALFRVVPLALSMRSVQELEREVAARVKAEEQLTTLNRELEDRVTARTAQLKAERELLQTTLHSIGDGVLMTDADGRITFLNAVAEGLTGWRRAEALGRPMDDVFRIIDAKTRKPSENSALRAIRKGSIISLARETMLIAKDGTQRLIDDSAAPIRGQNQTIIGAVLVFRDVSEKMRVVEELEAKEERLRLAVETTGVGIFDYAIPTAKLEWSTQCQALWGLPPDARSSPEIVLQEIHPAERWQAQAVVHAALDPTGSGDYSLEHKVSQQDGSERWLLIRGKTIFADNRPIRSIGTMFDITERRQREEQVQDAERREKERAAEIEAVLRIAPTPIWITHDPECKHVTGNLASYQLLQMLEGVNVSATATEPIARLFKEYRDGVPMPIEDLPLQRATATGRDVVGAEMTIVHENGTQRELYGNAAPIFDRAGQVRGAVAAFMDVTELKRSEQNLREADRRKDEFLATLAHELRNPLAPIRSSLEVLKRSPGDAAMVKQSLPTIERQLGQMVRLIDDLMDVSRITRNKLELRRVNVDLRPIVQQAVEAAQPHLDAAGHTLSVEMPPESIVLFADADRLAQVLSNLLTNACKYTEPGGQIALKVQQVGSVVSIRVRDNGMGIDPALIPSIFDMFTQIDRTYETPQSGLGIGLTIVKRLVELHEGTLSATSEGRGRGTEFTIRLPVVGNALPQAVEEVPAETPPAMRRILVVDDNEDAASTLAMLLTLTGNAVETAHDGISAVTMAESYRPDVILLDIGMPKQDGYAACRAIRKEPWGKELFLIALTGWGQESDRRKSREAGFDQHLVKPVDHLVLAKILAAGRPATSP